MQTEFRLDRNKSINRLINQLLVEEQRTDHHGNRSPVCKEAQSCSDLEMMTMVVWL